MGNSTNGAIKGLVTIVDRGRGSSLTALMNKRYSQIHILTMGVGTAGSEIMALLGLDSVEKDVIFSLVPADVLPIILTELSGKKFLKSSGKGIAFSLRLTGHQLAGTSRTAGVRSPSGKKGDTYGNI